ncbi:transglycosylase family protein [Saccharopolyspora shandongensis]|uniref:transglycosylase family protein n=1 Tax=Saccharopolyspora shandongensis TaxID=418495 RepID=UPI003F4D39E8
MKFGLFAKATVVASIVVCGVAPMAAASPSAPPAQASVWDRLAKCEAGGNWAANTGNGYYGGLQFNRRTWAAHGGERFHRYPHRASREQQIVIAEALRAARGGFGAWPACARKLGLPR